MADKGKGKPGSRSALRGMKQDANLTTKPLSQFSEGFDASPEPQNGNLPAKRSRSNELNKSAGGKPKNIQETKAWKESVGGVRRFWSNYINTLKTAFKRMNRRGQEELITRVCQIITVGTAIITMSAWYWFMPQQIRVLLLPVVILASWWIGTKVVGPSMIARFDKYLNPEEDDNN